MRESLQPAALLRSLFDAAVAAADPAQALHRQLPPRPAGRVIVVGAGKAAAAMAQALERAWPGPLEGVVVTADGHGLPCRQIEVREAAHPLPDARSQAAAQRVYEITDGLAADDTVVVLLSGGGSALLALPPPGVALAEKQAITRALLNGGAAIAEINNVRKHLSLIKGGRLAARCFPARVWTFAISDVPGDEPGVIASGPTVADATSAAQALAILQRYRIACSPAVIGWLNSDAAETVRPGDARLARAEFTLIATPQQSLEAAAALARAHGVEAVILGDRVQGEARAVASQQARLALQPPCERRPCVLLSGGETTVTVRGQGRGGRNSEFALALLLELAGAAGIWALAADTDGIDGSGGHAGAWFGPGSWARTQALGLDLPALLAANDSARAFEALDGLFVTGPTRTNVNDFRAILRL